MILKFYGAVRMVTGSNYMLERKGEDGKPRRILVDCGLRQGGNYAERMNFEPFPYDPKTISAVFITHAHIDHTGLIPKLYNQGFRGKVFGTAPTRDFAYELLTDSEDILKREAEREDKEPLYTASDVEGVLSRWQEVGYGESVEVDGFKATFKNAGHILGSSSIIIEGDGKSVIFSGDLGNQSPALINKYDKISEKIDYVVVESTYGDRVHENINEGKELLENIVEDTIRSGGVLMIPAFAMERTQRLLFELNDLVESRRIPKVPVFMDSPLAIRLTEIYAKHREHFSQEAEEMTKAGGEFLNFPGLTMTLETEESKNIKNVPPPKVIIAGSGMSNGGRILHHERAYLPDPKSAILFIGYQAKGTLGRRILSGEKTVRIFHEDVPVRCRIVAIGGYSAHADRNGIIEWLSPMREGLKKVFATHGEEEESFALATKIRDDMAIETEVPELNQEVELK